MNGNKMDSDRVAPWMEYVIIPCRRASWQYPEQVLNVTVADYLLVVSWVDKGSRGIFYEKNALALSGKGCL